MNFWGKLLHAFGWEVQITAPRREKCVLCVAPHTSNWDFILGILAYKSLGREANFLMKSFWFFFPMGFILRKLGGIPVERSRNTGLTSQIIDFFNTHSYVNLAVTPEGTRSAVSEWKTGFLRIALGAGVPVQLGYIDYKHKRIVVADEFTPTDNIPDDLEKVKAFYSSLSNIALYPEKFKT